MSAPLPNTIAQFQEVLTIKLVNSCWRLSVAIADQLKSTRENDSGLPHNLAVGGTLRLRIVGKLEGF